MAERYGVIGNPVSHSISPGVHQQFAAQFGITLDYDRIEAEDDNFESTVRDFFAGGGGGLNVTVPFKQAALQLCDAASDAARLAHSVNTLSIGDGRLHGDNTDGAGLVRDLARLGIDISGRRVLLIGAGGAARGVLAPLLAAAPAELVWSSRNPWVVEERAPDFAALGPIRPCTNLALKGDRFDVLINATSAGHGGQRPVLPAGLLAAGAAAYDLSYGEAARPFLDWAKREGAAAVHDGRGMLVEQAALSFEIWHGKAPQTAPVHATLAD